VLTFDDVVLPEDNLVQQLYREQTGLFFPELQQQQVIV
jgi:hypothetical protein